MTCMFGSTYLKYQYRTVDLHLFVWSLITLKITCSVFKLTISFYEIKFSATPSGNKSMNALSRQWGYHFSVHVWPISSECLFYSVKMKKLLLHLADTLASLHPLRSLGVVAGLYRHYVENCWMEVASESSVLIFEWPDGCGSRTYPCILIVLEEGCMGDISTILRN